MLDLAKKIYDRLPKGCFAFLRYAPNRALFGKKFSACLEKVSTKPDTAKNNLFEILCYARDNTQFWKKHVPANFTKADVKQVFDDLPFITSDELAADLDLFVSRRFNKLNSYLTTTGGTGRKPTTILLSNDSYAFEWAHMFYIWDTIGYRRTDDLKLTLRGKSLAGDRLFQYNPVYNEIVVDTSKMNASNFELLFRSLKKMPIAYIHGYPSLLREFRDYLETYGLSLSLKGIMLGSEGIELEEKKALSAFFRCPVISWYGQSEKVVLSADFECENRFKVLTSYGYPSLYQDNNGVGEIAGTTFVNKASPLIKYRTGDYGCIDESDDEIIISEIIGRWGKDFVYVNEDKKIPTTSINTHGPVQKEILFYQIYQNKYGELLIKILPKQTSKSTDDAIMNMFKEEMKDKRKRDIEERQGEKYITRTRSGIQRFQANTQSIKSFPAAMSLELNFS
jgi:phenylacetate-CoA ligase